MQQTLAKAVQAKGIGLHSGKMVHLKLVPAPAHHGIRFFRTDLGVEIEALSQNVDFSALQLATTLRKEKGCIQTTEHLMAALYAMGIDNLRVEVDSAEIPIMDGSAAPFIYLIEEAGIKKQTAVRRVLKVTKPFHFNHQEKTVSVYPCETFRISYEINFDHPLIQKQQKTVEINPTLFEAEVSRARTFGFLKDVQMLKKMGLIQGGSIDNAIVLDGDRMLNASLRQKDEFVSHKILDCVGDLALCGARFQGHVVANKAGHEVHALFLRALMASDAIAWENASEEEQEVAVHAEPVFA